MVHQWTRAFFLGGGWWGHYVQMSRKDFLSACYVLEKEKMLIRDMLLLHGGLSQRPEENRRRVLLIT